MNGTQVGDTIRIFSPMQTFDCSDAHVTSVTIIDEPDLTLLDCYKNEIERTNLDISGALNLEILNCYNNPKLLFLNLSAHKKLKTLDCRHDKKIHRIQMTKEVLQPLSYPAKEVNWKI